MRPRTKMTREEYLALEPQEGVKLEWVNGEAYAMSGGRPVHSAIAVNAVLSLGRRLTGTPCRPTNSDQRLYVEMTQAYFFPDVMVVCPPWQTVDGDVQSITNPRIIVEVLSPSTRDWDLGGKLEHYRRIPSLTDYVIVDPDARRVTHYSRAETGWRLHDIEEGAVPLADLGIELPLDELFADLDSVPQG